MNLRILRNLWIRKTTVIPICVPGVIVWAIAVSVFPVSAQDPNEWHAIVSFGPDLLSLTNDPSDPQLLYGCNRGFFFSTNAGSTWQYSMAGVPPELSSGMEDNSENIFVVTEDEHIVLYYLFDFFHENASRTGYYARHLFKSDDRGMTWIEQYPIYDIKFYNVCRLDPKTGIMIAGMNRPADDRDLTIQKSTDTGWTWLAVERFDSDRSLTSLEFSSAGDGVVYAGTSDIDRSILKSTDWGNTWISIQPPDWNAWLVYQIRSHPHFPDTVFAVLRSSDPIRRSTDGGQTWHSITPVEWMETQSTFRIHVAPFEPFPLFLYSDLTGSMHVSMDSGETWECYAENLTGRRIQYMNDNTAMFCSIESEAKVLFANHSVVSSLDMGKNWNLESFTSSASNGRINFSGTGRILMFSNNNGVLFSDDQGSSWSRSSGLHTYLFDPPTSILFDPLISDSVWDYAFLPVSEAGQPSLVLRHSSDNGAQWQERPIFSDVRATWVKISSAVSGRLFAIVDTNRASPFVGNSWIRISDDGGNTWMDRTVDTGICIWDIIDFSDNPDEMIILASAPYDDGYTAGIYTSVNGGETWTINPGFATTLESDRQSAYSDIGYLVQSTEHVDHVYLGFGKLFISRDRGASFSVISTGDQKLDAKKGTFHIEQHDPRVLYCSIMEGLDNTGASMRSCDGGQTWSDPNFPRYLDVSMDGRTLLDVRGFKKMVVSSESPRMMLGGYYSDHETITFLLWAMDPDIHDSVTGILGYMDNQRLPLYIVDQNPVSSGLFNFSIQTPPDVSGRYRFDLRAIDRFGNLSEPWPALLIRN